RWSPGSAAPCRSCQPWRRTSCTYSCGFLIWVDARFSMSCEVAEHFDGVTYAALVWINPTGRGEQKVLEMHFASASKLSVRFWLLKLTHILTLFSTLFLCLETLNPLIP
uniref:Uncharacterized protein n=1 Tax=Anabas testudineus TaxID=64144 RepID=A0A7N6BS02_ANATE